MRKLIASLTLVAALATPLLALTPASASDRWHALSWAKTQRGCWYHYGATGPCYNGYDCSGLVYRAYRKAGIYLPRTTYEMLNSRKLVRISRSQARRGDLAFYGPGHVEFATAWRHHTFGAQQSGTRVGFHRWNIWWHPTMWFHVRGAG
jgi:murein DD-endopeptidase